MTTYSTVSLVIVLITKLPKVKCVMLTYQWGALRLAVPPYIPDCSTRTQTALLFEILRGRRQARVFVDSLKQPAPLTRGRSKQHVSRPGPVRRHGRKCDVRHTGKNQVEKKALLDIGYSKTALPLRLNVEFLTASRWSRDESKTKASKPLDL